MYDVHFLRSRLHYVKAIIPYLTIRRVYNVFISLISYFLKLKKSGRIPPVIVLILTYKCNYQCIMCQKSAISDNPYKKPEDMDYERLERFLRANSKDLFLVQLFGGEPLYYKHIDKTIDLLHELNIPYCLGTNGALLSESICNKIIGRCLWLSISLDAANPEPYRYIRKGGNIYQIEKNLSYLNQLKKKTKNKLPILNANTTVFTYNITEVSPLILFCQKHHIKSLSVSGGKIYGTKEVNEKHLLKNYKEYAIKYIEEAKELALNNKFNLRVRLRSLYESNKKSTRKRTYKNTLDLYIETTIQPNFNIVAAGDDYLPMGNLINHSLEELWNAPHHPYFKSRSSHQL